MSYNDKYVNTREYELTGDSQELRFRDPDVKGDDGEAKVIFVRRQKVVNYQSTCIVCSQAFGAKGVPGKKRKVCDNPDCRKTYNRVRVWLHRQKQSTGEVTAEKIQSYRNRKVKRKDPRSAPDSN